MVRHVTSRGQAIVELLAGLFALLAAVLGLLFLSGLAINSLRIFKDASYNAETASRLTTEDKDENGEIVESWDISTWTYPERDVGRKIKLPFDPDSQMSTSTGTLSTGQFSDAQYSGAAASGDDAYVFAALSDLQGLAGVERNRFTRYAALGNSARLAANLVRRGANFNDHPVLTIDPERTGGAGDPVATEALEQFFLRLFGVTVTTHDLVDQAANQVYFPTINAR